MHLAVARSVLSVAIILAAFSAGAGEPSNPHPTSRFVESHADLPSSQLQLRRPVAATIHGPEVHRYRVRLRQGEFASVNLHQLQGNVAAVVFDPAGVITGIVDENGAGLGEVVNIVADRTGDYAIQVAVFEWDVPATKYAIELRMRERVRESPQAHARQLFSSWYDDAAPGAAIIVLQHGRVVYQDAIGLAIPERRMPMTTHTPIDLASVSKQFTAYGIALLVDRGKLSLDDDVHRYVPELPDFGTTMTIRHLLEHTSGLRDWDGLFGLTGTNIEDGITIDDVLAMLARQKALNFPPGSRQQYSNSGYVMLAAIIERVTGQPFDTWLADNVLQPLGMRECRLQRAQPAVPQEGVNSYRALFPVPQVASRGPMITLGSSSLACSAHDLTLWLANYASGRLGGSAVRRLVTEPTATTGGQPSDYVFGNWHSTRDGIAYVGHQGLAAGYRTSLRSFPAQGLAVIYLANDGNDATYPRVKKIEDLFLGIAPPKVEAPTDNYLPTVPEPLTADAVAGYVGQYYSPELQTTYTVEAAGAGIAARHAKAGVLPLTARGADTFTSTGTYLPEMTFVRDAHGRVIAFRIHSEDVGSLEFNRTAP
jgi:CubicO group peptidase (beta-lactamase class C family)